MGDHKRLVEEVTIERMEQAGSGGTSELLSWFPVLGAIGECPGESFGYTVFREFKCGIGGVCWDLARARH
jgi:hypothetical protein